MFPDVESAVVTVCVCVCVCCVCVCVLCVCVVCVCVNMAEAVCTEKQGWFTSRREGLAVSVTVTLLVVFSSLGYEQTQPWPIATLLQAGVHHLLMLTTGLHGNIKSQAITGYPLLYAHIHTPTPHHTTPHHTTPHRQTWSGVCGGHGAHHQGVLQHPQTVELEVYSMSEERGGILHRREGTEEH